MGRSKLTTWNPLGRLKEAQKQRRKRANSQIIPKFGYWSKFEEKKSMALYVSFFFPFVVCTNINADHFQFRSLFEIRILTDQAI